MAFVVIVDKVGCSRMTIFQYINVWLDQIDEKSAGQVDWERLFGKRDKVFSTLKANYLST